MDLGRFTRRAVLASVLCWAMLARAGALQGATFPEFVDPNPAAGNQFGSTVVPLSTGNVVITSPFDDAGGADAGAVYLFNGSTGALISTLRGSTANDNVGNGGVTVLSNGNYVVRSLTWDNGAVVDASAATWGSGTTGVSGVVSAANSLVGSTANDNVGSGGVTALSNGNYVVMSANWDNGAVTNAGAVTWGSGATGVSGAVSAANSLVGSTTGDGVGIVTALSNGNYVVRSLSWNNGAVADAGAVTWGSGTTGVSGAVSAANSLVGSTASDNVGNVTALSNGNYVVVSANWDNGAATNAGAVTWGSGTAGVSGVVSAANSLVGSTANDNVGITGVTPLSNGNYVVRSSSWDNGAVVNAGAATWCSGTAGVTGVVSAVNSLVGSTANDQVGSGNVTALSNGNYVVASQNWDSGAVINVGAETWGNGTTGVTGAVSAANSLVGSTANDMVGSVGATALTNGNYVVMSPGWDNGPVANAGAATWGSGTTGVTGAVAAANSLVGSTANDNVGAATALANGNYVVISPGWDNGAVTDAGAATWGSGTSGVTGVVSAANSLVGSTAGDQVALNGVTVLSNGNYLVRNTTWHNGAFANAGAVTWGSGATGVTGVVSAAISLVGSHANDFVGNGGVTELSNGNFLVFSASWDNGAATDAGAVTWGNGTIGVSGVVSAANSLVGSTASDNIGGSGATVLSNGNFVVRNTAWDNGAVVNAGAVTWGNGNTGVAGVISAANSLVGSTTGDGVGIVTALSNGNYVVHSPSWDNGALVDAGAVTLGSGTTGVTGVVSAANSVVGTTANTSLQPTVVDDFNHTFFGRFVTEGGGRVRVGSQEVFSILSVVDVRNDQGRQVRLSFARSGSDVLNSATPILNYYIYRREIVALASAAHAAPVNAATPNQALIAGWDYVLTVPATTDDIYQTVVPTLADSNASGFHRTVLFVRAATATPGIYFDSQPDSGWSADNLPPAPPAPFLAAYGGGATHLHWGPNGEPDLWYYAVYRGSSAGFTPGPSNLVATSSDTGYADVGLAGSYYKLSAVDVNGNESGFALVTPDGTTGVGGEPPVAFALEGVRPNPTRGNGLHVAFALPTRAAARLELLDVSGRRVLARDVGSLGAGRHTVNLAAGRSVVSGLYWVRLTQGANRKTTRVTVIE